MARPTRRARPKEVTLANETQAALDGSAMSPARRSTLVVYLLSLGVLLIYLLIKLLMLEFPDVAVVVEGVPIGPGFQAPAATEKPREGQPSPPAEPPPSVKKAPVLAAVFPHVTSGPAPAYELALYGTDFQDKLQVRLNGAARAPKTIVAPDLVVVVPTAADLLGTGTLVVEVVNPGGLLSNALALKVDQPRQPLKVWGQEWPLTQEVQLLLLVLLAGAMGSYVHALKSIADFIGNRTAMASWSWWYVSRPFLGAAMALIFYWVLRGGLLAGTLADARVVNPFGAMAVAALVGMFADKATQKLAEIFETLFKAEERRSGKLAAPVIDKLVPATVRTGASAAIDVKIVGERLGGVRAVKVDGKERAPERVSDKEVVVKLQPDDLKKSGTLSISVVTAEATSTSASLQISDLEVTTKALPAGKVGEAYSGPLAASGGTAPYTWTIETPPAGLKIDAQTGEIAGKPTKAGNVKAAVTVRDASGAAATREFDMQIA